LNYTLIKLKLFIFIIYSSVEELIEGRQDMMFDCLIHTDGFGVSFIFARKKREGLDKETVLGLEDFDQNEVEKYFLPCTVDPGRKSVFTATVGQNSSEHEIRSCTSAKRACYTGSKRRQHFVDNLKSRKGIKEIETQIPSPKTVKPDDLNNYIKYMLTHIDVLFDFYNERSAPFNFHNYQGRQRANDELANMLIDGRKKYNKARRKKTKRNKIRNRRRGKTKRQVRIEIKKKKLEKRKAKSEEKEKLDKMKSRRQLKRKRRERKPGKRRRKRERRKKWKCMTLFFSNLLPSTNLFLIKSRSPKRITSRSLSLHRVL
jgi:hypothetical protein